MGWIWDKVKKVGNFLGEVQAVISTGGFYLAYKYGKKMYDEKKELEKLMKSLNGVQSPSKEIDKNVIESAFFRGATNQVATGKTQPFHIGKNLYTPLVLNSGNAKASQGIHFIKNNEIFFESVYECGFNPLNFKKILMSDLVLKKFDNNFAQNGKFYFDATAFVEDSFFEIVQSGRNFETETFNKKIVESLKSDKIPYTYDEDKKTLFYTLEKNSMGMDLTIMFNGLCTFDSLGNKTKRKVDVNVFYSYNYAGLAEIGLQEYTTWNQFYFSEADKSTFEGNSLKQIFATAHVDFDYSKLSDYPITIKIEPIEAKKTSNSVDECFVKWIHSYIFDVNESKKQNKFVPEKIIEDKTKKVSTLLAVRIKSTQANEDKTDSIQIEAQGMARIFENGILSKDRKITSNPAAWALEVLTSDKHFPSKFDDEEIDIKSFAEWYNFCEEKKLEVNFIVNQNQTKQSILNQIFDCGRGYPYLDVVSNKYSVVFNSVKDSAHAPLLNEQTLIKFSYEKDMGRFPDGVQCKFIDSENDYNESTFILMYERYKNGVDLWQYPEYRDVDSTLKTLDLKGITNYRQAYRQAIYTMKAANFQRKSAIAEVGLEGITYKPLSLVLVQHPNLRNDLGSAEIKSLIYKNAKIVGAKLYNKLTFEDGKNYRAIAQHIENNFISTFVINLKPQAGLLDEIYFENSIKLSEGDIISFGEEIETTIRKMLITGINPGTDSVALTLVDYDDRVYDDSETLPEYNPSFSQFNYKTPFKINEKDNTFEKVGEMIQSAIASIDFTDLNISETPNIFVTLTSGNFSVDDKGITPIAQQISTVINVMQNKINLGFELDDNIILPDGYTLTQDGNTLTLHIAAGVKINPINLEIPIKYREYLYNFEYGDENQEVYQDDKGNIYGWIEFKEDYTHAVVGFSVAGVKGGTYLGLINDIENIPKIAIIGDYFTYGGETVDGFKKSGVYSFDGANWVEDKSDAHTAVSLSDVLSIANEDLQKNNSKTYEYLDHLTTNSIFVDKLVANKGFIENLFANKIELKPDLKSKDPYTNNVASFVTTKFLENAREELSNNVVGEIEGFKLSNFIYNEQNESYDLGGQISSTFLRCNSLSTNDLESSSLKVVKYQKIFIDDFFYWGDTEGIYISHKGFSFKKNNSYVSSIEIDDENNLNIWAKKIKFNVNNLIYNAFCVINLYVSDGFFEGYIKLFISGDFEFWGRKNSTSHNDIEFDGVKFTRVMLITPSDKSVSFNQGRLVFSSGSYNFIVKGFYQMSLLLN